MKCHPCPSPFDIPEILEPIGKHLQGRDQANCFRVSKTFYNGFILRCIERSSLISNIHQRWHPTGSSLNWYKHHIQRLLFVGAFVAEYFSLHGCRRLQTIDCNIPWLQPKRKSVKWSNVSLSSHSSLQHIHILSKKSTFDYRIIPLGPLSDHSKQDSDDLRFCKALIKDP